MWQKGLLGDSLAQVFLETMVFYCGLNFALHSGKEHRQLRQHPCPIELLECPGQRSYLQYTDDMSKNHPGGLRDAKDCYTSCKNVNYPECCFSKSIYPQLCPADAPLHAFYLQPSHHPTSTCWFSKRSLEHIPLGKTVGRICRSAEIQGYKTNHSLHAHTTTRLYKSWVDEQLIMECTGH